MRKESLQKIDTTEMGGEHDMAEAEMGDTANGKRKRIGTVIVIVLLIIGFGGAYYYYGKYQALRANPNLEAQKEVEELVLVVGKLMELPADETPTIATVQEKDKLKDQQFFSKAENGDKLLAYTKSMQAILYRPSTNKIVSVAPIVIQNNAPTPVSAENKTQ